MAETFLRLTDPTDETNVYRIRPSRITMYYRTTCPVTDHQQVTAVSVDGQLIYVSETCSWLDDAVALRDSLDRARGT